MQHRGRDCSHKNVIWKLLKSLSHLYFIYCKFFCSAGFLSCWTWKHTMTHWKCAVTYALCPLSPGGSNGLLWQHNRRDIMVPDPEESRGRWQHPATYCGDTPSTPAAQLPLEQAGPRRACRTTAHGPRGLKPCPVLCSDTGLPHPHSALWWGPWSWALRESEGLNLYTKRLLTVTAFIWIKRTFLVLGQAPCPTGSMKERTRRVSTNEASGDLCKRLRVFTLQSTVVLWDPWELNMVVLLTLGLLHFSHVCTNSSVNN